VEAVYIPAKEMLDEERQKTLFEEFVDRVTQMGEDVRIEVAQATVLTSLAFAHSKLQLESGFIKSSRRSFVFFIHISSERFLSFPEFGILFHKHFIDTRLWTKFL
jgi:hypothetical protein